MSELLTIDSLSVRDERHIILSGFSLKVARGEKVALVGESGSGKTMSLRSLLHILPSDVEITSGSITFNGTDVLGCSARERRERLYSRIGFVAQNTTESLHPLMKVSTQLCDAYRQRHKAGRKEAAARARELLVSTGMKDADRVLSSRAGQLSGGMRQRVNIASAMMDDIDLLIADEPTSALDAHVRRQIEQLYARLSDTKQFAMLVISHDLSFVRSLADRVYVMYAGKLVEEGLCEEIFSSPAHPYTRALISLGNIVRKNKDEDLDCLGDYVRPVSRDNASCAFAGRCRKSRDECTRAVSYRKLSETHFVRCNL